VFGNSTLSFVEPAPFNYEFNSLHLSKCHSGQTQFSVFVRPVQSRESYRRARTSVFELCEYVSSLSLAICYQALKLLDVIGLGVSTLDVLSLVEAFPPGDGIQRAAAVAVQGGGPVATAIVTAARLGASTAMIDFLGDDWRGAKIMAEYRQAGVATHFLRVLSDRPISSGHFSAPRFCRQYRNYC